MRVAKPTIALVTGLALASGCMVEPDGSAAAPAVTLALTDAASDDLASFVVAVTAVQLTRVGGATVGVLPQTASVDFVSLEETSQVQNVPAGLYASATVTLDFSGAEAYLVNETAPATTLDGDGNPLGGPLTLPVTIGNLLNAVAGRNRVLELDFDLDQSVMVDTVNNVVQVEPALVLRVDRSDPKDMFVAVVQAVDAAAGTIDVELPTLAGAPITDVTVSIDGATVYQVDGVPGLGASGLGGLRAESLFSWSEGGTTPADSSALRNEVGSLGSGLGIGSGTALELVGFFSAVDDDEDFVATSVINRDLSRSLILVHDRANGLTVTPTVTASEVSLAIQGSEVPGEVSILDRGFVVGVVPLPASPDPSIAPAGAFGWYTIRDRRLGNGSLHLTFAAFTQALDALLARGATLYNMSAIGTYDAGTNRITSGLATVVVH